jgi:SAM-dependent methyltransferase
MTKQGLDYVLSEAFQNAVESDAQKWDKEWMRYFSLGKDYSFYFFDTSTDEYLLSVEPEQIRQFDRSEMYFTKLFKNWASHIWVEGRHLVDKDVLEMGCGPGLLGRLAARFAHRYVGIDMSPFALSIARLTSPSGSEYVHISDTERLRALRGQFDACVGRHFFIHHNYEDALWILQFLRDLTRPGGVISADFFSNPATLDGDRRRLAADQLNDRHPSALYDFSDGDIADIAAEAALECPNIEYRPDLETRFATLRVPQTAPA